MPNLQDFDLAIFSWKQDWIRVNFNFDFFFALFFCFKSFKVELDLKRKVLPDKNAIKIIAKLDLILMVLLLQKLMSRNVVLKMKIEVALKTGFNFEVN